MYFPPISYPGALIVCKNAWDKESACRRISILCQQTSPKRWFGNTNVTSNCDVTNSSHQIQMTTICHWMNLPWKFSSYAIGYARDKGLRFSLQLTQRRQEAANSLPAQKPWQHSSNWLRHCRCHGQPCRLCVLNLFHVTTSTNCVRLKAK